MTFLQILMKLLGIQEEKWNELGMTSMGLFFSRRRLYGSCLKNN